MTLAFIYTELNGRGGLWKGVWTASFLSTGGHVMVGQQAQCLQGCSGLWCVYSPGQMPPLGYFLIRGSRTGPDRWGMWFAGELHRAATFLDPLFRSYSFWRSTERTHDWKSKNMWGWLGGGGQEEAGTKRWFGSVSTAFDPALGPVLWRAQFC